MFSFRLLLSRLESIMESTFRCVRLRCVAGAEGGGGGVQEAGAVIPGLHRQGRPLPAHLPAGARW